MEQMKYKERNEVVLVDESDNDIGVMEKIAAHVEGKLHRAFSVFIFNDKGELLLQQRALEKYHGAGLWTNTCCSHPQLNEDVKESALERLRFEMGIECEIGFEYQFIYKAQVENNLIEHELDYVFIGYSNTDPTINPNEVLQYKWETVPHILLDIARNPNHYTAWFKMALPIINEKCCSI